MLSHGSFSFRISSPLKFRIARRVVDNSPDPNQPLHRLDQLLRVVTHSILENDFNPFYLADVHRRVSSYYHQVGLLSYSNRADPRIFTKKLRTVEAGDLD